MNIIFLQIFLIILILLSPCVLLLYYVYKNNKYVEMNDITRIRLMKEIEMIEGIKK